MRTYDPRNVTSTFKTRTIDGYAPGTFIKASRNEQGFVFSPSASGGGARSRNPNKSGTIEFTLLNSSPANAILSAIALSDELAGTGVGEVLIKDRSTLVAQVSAQNAWIQKMPDWERAKELGETTWTLETDSLEIAFDGVIDA